MQLGGVMGGIYKISDVMMKLAYLNLLWLLGVLTGAVVLGIMPATIALFSIIRSWLLKDDTLIFHKKFIEVYKKEFFKSNLLGAGISFIMYLLFINFQVAALVVESHIIMYVLFFINIFVAAALALLLLFIFPIYVHFEMNLFQKVKLAMMMGITSPHITFAILVVIFLFTLLFIFIPGALFFFSISALAYCMMGVNLKKINDIKDKLSAAPELRPQELIKQN
ncbi:YesL family protein [Alkalicoccus daliensis]|uniref:Uncharacterized membrane protein YesL n=1 Tax=Alkalicoccus daliensis TaxID=745820 RepID=A0A1H0G9Z7_9BACI|nr:DUF624 domain-containing protein [Alkalicoccus daliensis]SDO03696.1 Uncharacterized membrane protein YesL [Alkalicoccus daliensis]